MPLFFFFFLLNCRHPDNNSEKAICTAPELRALNEQIEQRSAALNGKPIVADTEMPYLRERNNCSEEADVPACVKRLMTERLALLTRAETDPGALREAILRAKFIDIPFFWKYWPELVDRKVSVFGCLMPDDDDKTKAVLETENQPPVPLVFKSMPEETAEFLDDQKPCANWAVTLRKQGDKPFLYGEEVLGRPLP